MSYCVPFVSQQSRNSINEGVYRQGLEDLQQGWGPIVHQL